MTQKNSEYFMSRAVELARTKMRENCGGPFGVVIVKDNEIIAEGWNQVTSTNDPTAHAEIMAIRNACRKLNSFWLEGCDMYTSGEPCPMCMAAILWARIDHVYYAGSIKDAAKLGFDDSYFYDQLNKLIEKRDIAMKQCCREKILRVYEEWDKKEDKILY
jgi:guanine deaminase